MTYPHPPRRARGHGPAVALLLAAVGLVFGGCQGLQPGPLPHLKRFTEAAQADVVIKFNSWNYIFVLQPPVMDGAYRKILKAEEVGAAIRPNASRRDLAVVLVGWQLSDRDGAVLGEQWRELLAGEGFRRVVCIKPLGEAKLDGSPVVYDSAAVPATARR